MLFDSAGLATSNDPPLRRDFRIRRFVNSGGFRLPGEFEPQRALMVSCQAINYSAGVRDLIRAVTGRVTILALHGDEAEYESASDALASSGISPKSVRFAPIPHDSMWTRDYGPMALASRRGREIAVLDTRYSDDRAGDEVVPLVVAESARLPVVSTEMKLDGGNVIANGQGLVITTTRLFEDNPEVDERTMTQAILECFGASRVVYLEPLADEPTGHVDMFATFTSARCVVIGQYDPSDDEVNAEILERNARRLAAVRLPGGMLDVRRIPMPSNADGSWRTYTNVVYANGIVLMPDYHPSSPETRQEALATYQTLLPHWSVLPIDSDDLITSGGALHCVVMNLGPLSAERIIPTATAFRSTHRRLQLADGNY
jgi:agmatine/peptidylarginine deiminase